MLSFYRFVSKRTLFLQPKYKFHCVHVEWLMKFNLCCFFFCYHVIYDLVSMKND